MPWRLVTYLLFGLAWLALVASVWGQTVDDRFLDGLRERRLFQLAEKCCLSELQASRLTDERRAQLAVELSRTYAQHALHSAPSERDARWTQAMQVTETFLKDEATNPQVVLVQVQAGLVNLAHGELLRQEAEVVPGGKRLEESRHYLRTSIAQLQAAGQEIAVQLRRQNLGQANGPGVLTADELAPLAKNVNYQLARAFRNQGQSYPPASADRSAALLQAVELLDSLAKLDTIDPLAWQSRLDEVICYGLLDDADAAARRLSLLDEQHPPPEVVLAARAERLQLALKAHRLDDARKIVEAGRAQDGRTSSELDYATVEAYLAFWRASLAAEKPEEANRWQTKASDMIHEIDRLYGPYWSRRAEGLLAGIVSASSGTDDVAVLMRAAESYYRAGRDDEAVTAFDRTRQQAETSKDFAKAFSAGYTAAAIEQQQKHLAEAAARFRQLSLAMRENEKAPDAHLLAIYNSAQLLTDQTPAAWADYVQMLEEHLKLWPTSATADQSRLWLGRWQERQRAWPEAIAAYSQIKPDRLPYAEAITALGRCYSGWLEDMRATGKPTGELASTGAQFFEHVITGTTGQLPLNWTPVDRVAALTAARIWLTFTSENARRAEQIITSAVAASADAPAEWKQQAQLLLAFALAGQGRRDEASKAIEQVSAGEPAQLLPLLQSLAEIAESATPEVRRELAELSLRAAQLMNRAAKPLTADEQRRFGVLYARALAAAGNRTEALTTIESFAKTYPRDADVQEEYGRLLLTSGDDAASLHLALEKWREVEQASRPGTARWFRAKYYLALTHEQLGNHDRAAKIIKLTQVLHPELGGPEMQPKFLSLLKQATDPNRPRAAPKGTR
jgi:hypothetical protein